MRVICPIWIADKRLAREYQSRFGQRIICKKLLINKKKIRDYQLRLDLKLSTEV